MSEVPLLLPYSPRQWQRRVQRLAAARWASALLAPILHRLDLPLMRISRGRVSLTSLLTGLPVVALTTIGARTGKPRCVPLVAIPASALPLAEQTERPPVVSGEQVILIASNFGRQHHPGWYYNLRANPRAWLESGGLCGAYLARLAEGEERERLWQMAEQLYSGYSAYRRRAAHREIGIFVLTPVGATQSMPLP